MLIPALACALFLLVGLGLYLSSTAKRKPYNKPPQIPDFFGCVKNSDCIVVDNHCDCFSGGSQIAINKKYKAYWEKRRAGENCIKALLPSDDPSCLGSQVATCRGGKCELQRGSTEESFSDWQEAHCQGGDIIDGINLPKKGIRINMPRCSPEEALVAIYGKAGEPYDAYIFRASEQKDTFLNCLSDKTRVECNLYPLGVKVSLVENPSKLGLEEFVARDAKEIPSEFSPTAFKKEKLGNYEVMYRDYEGMGQTRELYLSFEDKICIFAANGFADQSHTVKENLDLLNKLVGSGLTIWTPEEEKEEVREEERSNSWTEELIKKEESAPAANPPASLTRCSYKNRVVYYLPPRCCDVPSTLYDEEGKIICHPDGGFTGKGDGKCSDYSNQKSNCTVIWRDTRTAR